MKKFVSAILAVFILGLLSGCGSKTTSNVPSNAITTYDLLNYAWSFDSDSDGTSISGTIVFVDDKTCEFAYIMPPYATINNGNYSFTLSEDGQYADVRMIFEEETPGPEEFWRFKRTSIGKVAGYHVYDGKEEVLSKADISTLESKLAACDADSFFDFREGSKYVKADVSANKSSGSKTSSGSKFTNAYGTPTTKCYINGCNNFIASSGDTNCCEKHSNKCLNCGDYIDSDAMYCMKCITESATRSKK